AVAVENDRWLVQAGCVGVGRVLDGADDPGCRRMQRAAEFAIGNGQQLPLEYSVAGIHHRLGSTADMLQQREDQARGQRWVFQPAGGGLDLVLGWVNATGDIPDTRLGGHQDTPRWSATSVGGGGAIQPQFWVVTGSGSMSMQSTGQGSTHRSQPVHSSMITVCICFAAPRMASTGHA